MLKIELKTCLGPGYRRDAVQSILWQTQVRLGRYTLGDGLASVVGRFGLLVHR